MLLCFTFFAVQDFECARHALEIHRSSTELSNISTATTLVQDIIRANDIPSGADVLAIQDDHKRKDSHPKLNIQQEQRIAVPA